MLKIIYKKIFLEKLMQRPKKFKTILIINKL